MTLMTVQASVASYLADSRPQDVRAALAVIETTGRDALAELRRMLGVLRSDGTPDTAGWHRHRALPTWRHWQRRRSRPACRSIWT